MAMSFNELVGHIKSYEREMPRELHPEVIKVAEQAILVTGSIGFAFWLFFCLGPNDYIAGSLWDPFILLNHMAVFAHLWGFWLFLLNYAFAGFLAFLIEPRTKLVPHLH